MIVAVLLPVLAGLILPHFLKDMRLRLAVAAALGAELVLVLALTRLDGGVQTVWRMSDSLSIAFSMDAAGRLLSCLIAALWLLAGCYAFDYMRKEHDEGRFFRFYVLSLGALMGVCYADNLFTFLVCFEAMTFSTLPLVLHERTEEARRAGYKYLGFSIFGVTLVLFAFFLLKDCGGCGSFQEGGIIDAAKFPGGKNALLTLYVLTVVGFGAKAGMFPLHSWLPVAHPAAPSPASAVLSGAIVKCGALGILRMTYQFFGTELLGGTWAQTLCVTLALLTVFLGSMLALREKLLKRRLAYSTVSQVSYALFGIFLMSEGGLEGAYLQILYHGLAKTALFLWAGAVIQKTGLTRVDELRGLGRRMPLTMGCFTVASLSLIGIPPTGGFSAKWLLATAALDTPYGVWGGTILILSALLTAGYLLPMMAEAFFPGKDFPAGERAEITPLMLYPMLALCGAVVLLGLFPAAIFHW